MDPVDVVALARQLIDIDSTTGREGEVCAWLAAWLRGRGYSVFEQRVSGDRANLVATSADPLVILTTHLDCVPPFFPSGEQDGRLTGRGSCDAKGIVAAQVAACERLRAAGERRAGLLFVVGEERGSDGAKAAAADLTGRIRPRFIVNGEPTDGHLASATRGVWRVKVRARGRAAHSAYPDLGESAIEKLLDALAALRGLPLPEDSILGRTSYVVGLINGGIAPNVVPPEAEAEITFRTVGPSDDVRAVLGRLRPGVELEHVLDVPAVRFPTIPGFETRAFPFTTDAGFLHPLGQVLLLGPGSVKLSAHTDHEYVEIAELHRAVDTYERLVGALLAA